MKLRFITGLALALGVLGVGMYAYAQREEWVQGLTEGGGRGSHLRLMAMLDNDGFKTALGLTDQQTDRLRQILVVSEKSAVETRAGMAVRGIELRELLRADKPDRDAVMKKVQEISDLRRDMMRQHVNALLDAKTVLTPEQQKKVRSLIESRGAFGHEPERRWGHPGGGLEGRPGGPPPAHPEPPEQPN